MSHTEHYVTRLARTGITPKGRPARARAIIVNPEGTRFIGITRRKPRRDPYIVLPGGGIEKYDRDGLACARREVEEEVGLKPRQVRYEGRILTYHDQHIYIGTTVGRIGALVMNGPERGADPKVRGTYEPRWFKLCDLPRINLQPTEIGKAMLEAYRAV